MSGVRVRLRAAVRRRRIWLNLKFLQLLYYSFRFSPPRAVFLLLVLCSAISSRASRVLNTAFTPVVVRALDANPKFCFATIFSHLFPASEVSVLHSVGAHREVVELMSERGAAVAVKPLANIMARSLFELGDFRRAKDVLDVAFSQQELALEPPLAHLKGLLDIVCNDLASAAPNLEVACRGMSHIARPHHNLAARASMNYSPNALDSQAGDLGRIFDAANYVGQRVTHVGRGELGDKIYTLAIDAQKSLEASVKPAISRPLKAFLEKNKISYATMKIIPEEWATQVGHLGMMDMLFRMREIGWWRGDAVMTPQPGLIANHAFLRLFEPEGKVFLRGVDVPGSLTDEFSSLQRWKGLAFNAFELPDGTIVPWQDAGAIMLQQWEKEGRGYPLRDRFDAIYGANTALEDAVSAIKQTWGMKPGDWYVCLHMRDASHYGELAGTGQSHRNASVKTYMEAIRYITEQGGWVIKLGGPNSPKLPKMARVVDYARSVSRSDIMDLHLIRHARCFIGTTSGLTNVAVSFGVPAALVNCITTDAQLWTSRVRFCLKWIKLRDGTVIDQYQLTSTPWRWRVFSAELLGRFGARIHDNTADEILETVKETLAFATSDESYSRYLASVGDAKSLLSRWKDSLALPYFYGCALPSVYSLTKVPTFLDPHAAERASDGAIGPKSRGGIPQFIERPELESPQKATKSRFRTELRERPAPVLVSTGQR